MSKYMLRCLELAKLGWGTTNPNPMVGCVIIKQGKVLGEGWHRRAGEPHAEVIALKNCREDPQGADLYVNLEPCCHSGRTPPCTEAILAAKIARCFIGSLDPNPLVSGQGVEFLRREGIEVITGILVEECDRLNEIFFTHIFVKRPFVILKSGCSLDGRISDLEGKSRWITSETSRKEVHHWRQRVGGILTGIGTILADDPALDNRSADATRQPWRIVLDSNGRLPLNSRVLSQPGGPLCIFGSKDFDVKKKRELESRGTKIILVDKTSEGLNLRQILTSLSELSLDSVLVEGGSHIMGSFFQQNLWDKFLLFLAPRLLGAEGHPLMTGWNPKLDYSRTLQLGCVRPLGEDICIEAYPLKKESAYVYGVS